MIDCCNAQLQIPKRDILLSFEHKRDRSYYIHNKNGTCNVSWNCFPVFTLYVYPYMSNGVSYINLLDELITTFRVLLFVFFFFIQIFSE